MTGKYLLPAILATAMLTSSCAGQSVPRSAIAPSANPSAIIAAEIAFNRLAQEKGQWTAFRETAAKDAVMFVPEVVLAQEWLKGRTDPPKSVTWQPHKAFMSCDGRTGVTTGAWQRPDGSVGYFTTVWQWIGDLPPLAAGACSQLQGPAERPAIGPARRRQDENGPVTRSKPQLHLGRDAQWCPVHRRALVEWPGL